MNTHSSKSLPPNHWIFRLPSLCLGNILQCSKSNRLTFTKASNGGHRTPLSVSFPVFTTSPQPRLKQIPSFLDPKTSFRAPLGTCAWQRCSQGFGGPGVSGEFLVTCEKTHGLMANMEVSCRIPWKNLGIDDGILELKMVSLLVLCNEALIFWATCQICPWCSSLKKKRLLFKGLQIFLWLQTIYIPRRNIDGENDVPWVKMTDI